MLFLGGGGGRGRRKEGERGVVVQTRSGNGRFLSLSLFVRRSTFLFLPLVTIIPLAVDVAQYPRGSDLRTPSRIR